MNKEELITKLQQIEEQAQLTLEEFPKNLTRERQRMIIALARYLRTAAATAPLFGLAESSNEDRHDGDELNRDVIRPGRSRSP